MPIKPGELRLGPALRRVRAALLSGARRAASSWARVLETEEQRFQDSIGNPQTDPEGERAESKPCAKEDAAPDLTDLIRQRQAKQAPKDFMYPADRASEEKER